MHPFRADLHCHSSCSDGSLTPPELVRAAHEAGLQGLSITDHDTVEAYKTAFQAAVENQIELIPGVEFSASLDGHSVHILGYSFDVAHPAIHALCERQTMRRQERNLEILDKLAAAGMPLTLEEVKGEEPHATLGRPHIALAMVKKGYVHSVQEAFKRYIGDGRPAYSKGAPIGVDETLDTLRQAHGLAIIAHPHLIDDVPLLKKLLEMPFDGIECYYSRFPADANEPWIELATKRNWLMTGGSDFHGAIKPTIALGSSWVNEELFRRLQDHYLKK